MPCTLDFSYLKTSPWKNGLFNDKVVFVTGGAGTICRVQVEALVLLGANAAILGRRTAETEQAAREIQALRPGAKVIAIGGVDVRNIQSIKNAVDMTVNELGKIDFVIAGAAGNFLSNIAALSSNAFRTVIEIDLIGSYNTLKACLEQLVKNKGHVIFITATLQYYGLPFQAHASAAKAGIDSLMRTVSVEYGPLGVRSNAIAPGPIDNTEGLSRLLPEDMKKRATEVIPMQRMGTTQDIADATVFLFSDSSSYITGTVTVVDGAAWQTGQSGMMDAYPKVLAELNKKEQKL